MYAVIKTGGKQYKVSPGDVIEVDHLSAKSEVSFTPILVVTAEGKSILGAADLKAHAVKARILGDAKGDKVTVFKYRPKSGYASKTGHRQLYSMIEIISIGAVTAPASEGAAEGVDPAPDAAAKEESGA